MKRRELAGLLAWPLGAAPVHGQGADDALPWFEAGQPGPQLDAALALLADAASHGLDATELGLPALQQARQAALDDGAQRAFGHALTAAMQRYLNELHFGRIAPGDAARQTPHAAPDARPPFDAAATLRAAFALQDLPAAVRAAVPGLSQYQRLREVLVRYRALVDHPAWQEPLAPLPTTRRRAVEPGQAWPGLACLHARLVALEDLAADVALPALYDATLEAGVRAFQQRHGLEADGVIGRATWAALAVTPAARVRQLGLMLERLRWTPLPRGPRAVVINLPEFRLRAYEVVGERIVVRLEMPVIVGAALDHRTPLMQEALRRIEFRPFWNVPASIARKELIPRLRREPEHWAQEGFEFVSPAGADAQLSEAKLQAVLAGQLRIRQRPGPRNALGDIKFVLPNDEAVYLHHTPSVRLFARPRRDFSHGCIRVEDPVALAAFALQGQPGWDAARIRAAMSAAAPSTQTLAEALPVLISYGTALVREGRVHFFEDIYGHDRTLEAALSRRPR